VDHAVSTRHQNRGYGFELVNLERGGDRRTVARFTCKRCGEQLDLSVVSGTKLNPMGLTNAAKYRGWVADPVFASACRCPQHISAAGGNDTDSELRKFEGKMAMALIPQPSPSPPASQPVVALRDPTPDQRAMIRTLLEKHFDEEHGYYLAGYSDARIAEDANVPRVAVEKLRDAAYGPIKVSPEIIAIREEMAALSKRIDTLERDAVEWAQNFGREVSDAKAGLRELGKRIGDVKASAA
jgi:hypothetical protein